MDRRTDRGTMSNVEHPMYFLKLKNHIKLIFFKYLKMLALCYPDKTDEIVGNIGII